MELNTQHEEVSQKWTELIRERFAVGLGKPALWLAEQVGKHYEPRFDDINEDEDD